MPVCVWPRVWLCVCVCMRRVRRTNYGPVYTNGGRGRSYNTTSATRHGSLAKRSQQRATVKWVEGHQSLSTDACLLAHLSFIYFSVSLYLCVSLCLCLSLSVAVCLCLSLCLCLFVSNLPFTYVCVNVSVISACISFCLSLSLDVPIRCLKTHLKQVLTPVIKFNGLCVSICVFQIVQWFWLPVILIVQWLWLPVIVLFSDCNCKWLWLQGIV